MHTFTQINRNGSDKANNVYMLLTKLPIIVNVRHYDNLLCETLKCSNITFIHCFDGHINNCIIILFVRAFHDFTKMTNA